MKVLFIGGDKRQIEIVNYFNKKNYEIDVIGYENIFLDEKINKINLKGVDIGNYNVVIFPVSGVKDNFLVQSDFTEEKLILDRDFLKGTNKNAIIFTGIKTKYLEEMLEVGNKDVVVLMSDKEVIKKNAIPTVEGIIADLVYSTDHTVDNSNILVLGYGNVGKLLTNKLRGLGANVEIGISLFREFKELKNNNVKCIYFNNEYKIEEILKNKDIIINTIPTLTVNKEKLKYINKDAYILDISSHPHGVDFEEVNKLNIKNKLLLGIPGKTAPKTSGLILIKKIDHILERSK